MRTQGTGLFALLLLIVVARAKNMKTLDLSPAAVDDRFMSCRQRMMKKVMDTNGLLMKELNKSTEFCTAWKGSTAVTSEKLEEQHIKALEAYASNKKFRLLFNKAVELQGWNASTYQSSFPYKSFHFLLTDALLLLKQKCVTVFRGSETSYNVKVGSLVRFGRFTAAHSEKNDVEEMVIEEGTVFNITSCSAVDIEPFVHKNSDISWLIAPYEVFNVTSVKSTKEYKEITLVSHDFQSNHNCSMFKDAGSSSRHTETSSTLLTLGLCVSLVVGSMQLSP